MQVPPNSTLRWGEIGHDPDNKYDNSSGEYTVPHHGNKQFSLIMQNPPTANNTDFVVFVDTTPVHQCSMRKNDEQSFVEVGKKCTWNLQLRAYQKNLIHNSNQNGSIVGKFEGSVVTL